MEIPILIERIEGNGYRARGSDLFGLSADGPTEEEALARLKDQLRARMATGDKIVALQVPDAPHPLAKFAGMFKDDPDFQEVMEIIAENHRRMDADPDVP